ncbi:MAG: nucleotidyltransferase family protein [Candidatus Aenigmarchaeota archaeon]|nr:nucleotidyltransferase family protein [Candidatus Aenigmarchaeota archaeon]
MKAIILCGGFAKRLGSIAQDKPKTLLDMNGKPLLMHILENLATVDAIDHIFISTNQKFGRHLEDFAKTLNLEKKLTVIVEPAMREDEKLGSIGGLHFLITSQGIDDDCLVINGDNLLFFTLPDFVLFAAKKQGSALAVWDAPSRDEAKKFGVVTVNQEGKIIGFEEKPENPKTLLVSTGCYFFSKHDVMNIDLYIREGNDKDKTGNFIAWLSTRKNVYAYQSGKPWFDIGDPQTLENARQFLQNVTQ